MRICSPMPSGSGAIVVHQELAKNLELYHINTYSPLYEYFPFLIRRSSNKSSDVIHTTPDHALFHIRKKQLLVVTIHGYMLDNYMQGYSTLLQKIHYKTDLKFFTKMSLKKATVVTAVSQFLADKVREDLGFTGHIQVIPNGVDVNKFKPSSTETPTSKKDKTIRVLFSGNPSKKKGAHWLLPILEKLDTHIDIVYTSGLRGENILPDHPRLHCLGSISHDEMPQIYQQADMLLFPTVREGFGLAAAEAMACGLPVVATNCSALPEFVHHGKGGFLCSVGDIDGFAEKINFLASESKLREKMGKYNRALIKERYTLKKMINAYKTLFAELDNS